MKIKKKCKMKFNKKRKNYRINCMSLRLCWDDFPEQTDDKAFLDNLLLKPAAEACNNYDCTKSISDSILSSSVLIKGDNYPVLQLMKDELLGKVNIIYIDPPYNTGNAFTYKDNFSTSDDRHSAWLSFMNRRLKLAREMLADDGCIFIAIDQSELYVLKLLCDSIFGEDNFVNDYMWLHGKGKKDTWSRTLQQNTLCYAKDKTKLKSFTEVESTDWAKTNADDDPRGNWFSGSVSFTEKRSNPKHKNYYSITSPSGIVWTRQWQKSREEMDRLLAENRIYFGPAPEYNSVPRIKIFNGEQTEVIPRNIIDCVDSTRKAQRHLDKLLGVKGVFDNPKPVELISHLIEITQIKRDALVMDFFAGSGTTFEAVAKVNVADGGTRRCILVQSDEVVETNNQFRTIFDICRKRCELVAEKYNQELEVWELVMKAAPSVECLRSSSEA